LRYLIDTNVLSDAHKRVREPSEWLSRIDPAAAYISVLTIGEIERGIQLISSKNPARAAQLQIWLQTIRGDFHDRLLTIDEEVSLVWGRITTNRMPRDADSLIAATAIVHGLTVVTRNVADFADTGVAVVNPWTV
jgi:predicted nucleic acid-binding protein